VYGKNVDNIPPSGQFPGREQNPDPPNMEQARHEDIQFRAAIPNKVF
jgi:hypothetical protein